MIEFFDVEKGVFWCDSDRVLWVGRSIAPMLHQILPNGFDIFLVKAQSWVIEFLMRKSGSYGA